MPKSKERMQKETEWDRANTVRFSMKLNKHTDADIITAIEGKAKATEIKRLIRLGLASEKEKGVLKMAKKYQVENKVDNADQYYGRVPHADIYADWIGDYIDAETAEEAIEYAMDTIVEEIVNNSYTVERDDDQIIVRNDDGEVINCYYHFIAKEIND